MFWVPKDARWSHLKANAKRPEIGTLIDDAMLSIEKDNESLKGVLPKDYARPALNKVMLGELIDLISGIAMNEVFPAAKAVCAARDMTALDGFQSDSLPIVILQRMDVAPLHVRASELDTAAKYAIYALVTLIAALRDVIDALCDSAWAVNRTAQSGAAEVPAMKEFFQFAWADRQYVMRKRQWP